MDNKVNKTGQQGVSDQQDTRLPAMTDALDVSLLDAWERGDLQIGEFAAMNRRCASCSDVDACRKLLVQRKNIAEAPQYCGNKAILDRLQKQR